ncbi:hypothetical protein TRVL_04954 [Trypanosoma vivax]|nr:hypothetical protein TRVL_04954 [Trypanosoma vivax]
MGNKKDTIDIQKLYSLNAHILRVIPLTGTHVGVKSGTLTVVCRRSVTAKKKKKGGFCSLLHLATLPPILGLFPSAAHTGSLLHFSLSLIASYCLDGSTGSRWARPHIVRDTTWLTKQMKEGKRRPMQLRIRMEWWGGPGALKSRTEEGSRLFDYHPSSYAVQKGPAA